METRHRLRRYILGFSTAVATAALGIMAFGPALAASTSGSLAENPVFMIWKPGTPLPTVPAGYTLMVWPPEQVEKSLTVGQAVPTVTMDPTKAATFAATPASYTTMENSAGLVNLDLRLARTPGAFRNNRC